MPMSRYEILDHLPPYGPMYIPVTRDGEPCYSEGYAVRFYKSDGSEWVANFQLGWTGLRTVLELTETTNLLIIADGACYLIDPDKTVPIGAFGADFSAIFTLSEQRYIVQGQTDKKEMTGLVDEDLLVVEDPQWVYSKMGLANLAQLCNHYRPSKWKSIIREHFDAMKSQAEFESEFYENVHDYSYAAPFIAIRVHPKEYASHLGEEFTIKQQIAEDLIALLVFDFPHGISTIRPETRARLHQRKPLLVA